MAVTLTSRRVQLTLISRIAPQQNHSWSTQELGHLTTDRREDDDPTDLHDRSFPPAWCAAGPFAVMFTGFVSIKDVRASVSDSFNVSVARAIGKLSETIA